MHLGTFLFAMIKKNQTAGPSRKIATYTLFSKDSDLKIKVENLLGKKVTFVDSTHKNDLNSPTEESDKNIEIIFDNNVWSFKAIIDFMERHQNKRLTFKILPANSDFILGSNSSNDLGKVIRLQ